MRLQQTTKISMYFPTIGILVFVLLYLYASTLYPGGSQENIAHIGFDWIHNYWCNLTSEIAINGALNPARPFAMAAMIILCVSLSIFFIRFAKVFAKYRFWKILIQVFGIISMVFTLLIFTAYHNIMIGLSSIFGVVAVIGIITEVYQSNLRFLKWTGVAAIGLLALNNYIYYTDVWIEFLPLLQKLTFAYVLLWVMGLNQKLIKQSNK